MEKHIIGENGIGYTLGADSKASFLVNSSVESVQASFPADELYYPDLVLAEGTHYHIGRYGRMRREYLKPHRRGEYIRLLMDGKLNKYLLRLMWNVIREWSFLWSR